MTTVTVNLNDELNPYKKSVDALSNGLLHIYEPNLVDVKKQLQELTEKQNALYCQLHDENLNLSEVQHNNDLEEMFNRMKIYQAKLIYIKKDIKTLHERSTKLKKRALKLQQVKENAKKIKDNEVKIEEQLIG